MNAKTQLEIDFTPGLTEQFPDFSDCLKASVYGCGRQFKAIAADLDMSASELSRKLANNPSDNVNFPAKLLPELLASTKDLSPLYWLLERFVEQPEAKRRRALDQLVEFSRQLPELLKKAGV